MRREYFNKLAHVYSIWCATLWRNSTRSHCRVGRTTLHRAQFLATTARPWRIAPIVWRFVVNPLVIPNQMHPISIRSPAVLWVERNQIFFERFAQRFVRAWRTLHSKAIPKFEAMRHLVIWTARFAHNDWGRLDVVGRGHWGFGEGSEIEYWGDRTTKIYS